jgi:hypothetical protein
MPRYRRGRLSPSTSIALPGPKPSASSPAAQDSDRVEHLLPGESAARCRGPSRACADLAPKAAALTASSRVSVVSGLEVPGRQAGGQRAACRHVTLHAACASQVGLDDARVGDHVGGTPVPMTLAIAQHQHAVADAGDDIHVVLDQQHRDAALVARVEHEARHVLLLLLVHAGHRLVQDQEARLGHQRAGQFDALLQADGDAVDGLVAHALQLHEVDRLLDQPAVRDLLGPRQPPVERGAQHDPGFMCTWRPSRMLSSTDMPLNSARFWKVRATPRRATLCGAMPVMSRPFSRMLALLRRVETGDGVGQRRLAAAVGADQAEDLAAAMRRSTPVSGHQAAEAALNALAFKDRYGLVGRLHVAVP